MNYFIYINTYAQQIGLKDPPEKTKLMILDITNLSPSQLNGEDLPTTEEFTFLGNIVRHYEGAGNISNHLNKARNAFRMLNKTKLRLCQNCVVSTLL